MPGKYYVIAGYIGEKNSRLQLYLVDPEEELVDGRPPPGELKHDQTFRNHEYGTFIQVVETFLGQCYRGALPTVTCACFAVAGPVDANHVTFSNRSNWVIDGHMLERHLRFKRIELINDFVSAGYGFLTLREDESVTLQEAPVLQAC
jgi:glucokinase